jgi:hypothetical protein
MAGMIGGLLPEDFFRKNLGSGILPMLLIALLATPMYMCATASTPIAAALVAKGVSPGAALVFLLVGPATNMATMTTVGRFLGRRSLVIYLASMILTSVALGLGLDAFAGESISATVRSIAVSGGHGALWMSVVSWIATFLLIALVANGVRLRLKPFWRSFKRRMGWEQRQSAAASTGQGSCCTFEVSDERNSEGEPGGQCDCGSEACHDADPHSSGPDSPAGDESCSGHDCCSQ